MDKRIYVGQNAKFVSFHRHLRVPGVPSKGQIAPANIRGYKNMPEIAVSVIIPTFRRAEMLLRTLERIADCDPPPAEILVHVDAGDDITAPCLARSHPNVVLITSDTRQGPGGGRNRLVRAASYEYLVSLDDDSWPNHADFFLRVSRLLEEYPRIALFACRIIERDAENALSTQEVASDRIVESAAFGGGGCVFRRSAFLDVGGYLPLETAYAMEEADMALGLINKGHLMGYAPQLSVYHDTDRPTRHAEARINSAHVTNTALLAFLRYPKRYWPYGALQVGNRVRYCLIHGRYSGLLKGIADIPAAIWRYRAFRSPVAPKTIQHLQRIRRSPLPIEPLSETDRNETSELHSR